MPVVELFGQARVLAGVRSLCVEGKTVREVLLGLAQRCPELVGPVLEPDGHLTPAYMLNLNGTRFTSRLDEPLAGGDELLIISSLSGG